MRLFVAWVLVIAGALGVAWLLAGRRFALLLDRFLTARVATPPVGPIRYDGGGFRIGSLDMAFGSTNNLRYDLALSTDLSNRVILSTAGRSFTLGPRTNPGDLSGRPEIDFAADPGDQLSLTAVRSVLGWPTPLEFNFMTPHSPWWKRYVYYRLVWRKASGAQLEMLWRYQQQYVTPTGWTEPLMMWNSETGLLRVDIR